LEIVVKNISLTLVEITASQNITAEAQLRIILAIYLIKCC